MKDKTILTEGERKELTGKIVQYGMIYNDAEFIELTTAERLLVDKIEQLLAEKMEEKDTKIQELTDVINRNGILWKGNTLSDMGRKFGRIIIDDLDK